MRRSLPALLLVVAGCLETPPVPYTTVPEGGIRREVFRVTGIHAPNNPGGAASPTALEATTVVRYRRDLDNPSPAEAIVIAMPGFLAGANTFDQLARTLVRRSVNRGGTVEVWAIDRRANLLEDTEPMEQAEAEEDPQLAVDYYQNFEPYKGRTYAGDLDPASVLYMSEWGLETHVEDLRRVLALIPAAERKAHVFLMGHSLGGAFVEAYGAWQFESDSKYGFEDVAGFIAIDGILDDAPVPETTYLDGSTGAGFPMPGLTTIRTSAPYTALPVLGAGALVTADIVGLRAYFDPNGVVSDPVRDMQFQLLFALPGTPPAVTNLAALGLAFDSQYEPLPFVRASIGTLNGPTETFTSIFGGDTLLRPSDPNTTYTFTSGPTAPDEYSSAFDLAVAMTEGRGNFSEWYFPSRLALDLAASGGAALPTTGYPATYGLRSSGGASNDAPFLCIAAGLVGNVSECDRIRGRLAPTIGAGRARAGATRGAAGEDAAGFGILDVTSMAHVDPLLARDGTLNPVPARIEQFLIANRGPGAVFVGAQPSP